MRLPTSWTVDAALFTGGLWNLDLTRVKKNLEETGWSVNNVGYDGRFDTNPSASRLADVYGYGPAGLGGATIVTPGSDVTVPVDGGVSGNGTIHVEIFQYIEAHDLEIRVGDDYKASHSLEWIRSYDLTQLANGGSDLGSVTTTEEDKPEQRRVRSRSCPRSTTRYQGSTR